MKILSNYLFKSIQNRTISKLPLPIRCRVVNENEVTYESIEPKMTNTNDITENCCIVGLDENKNLQFIKPWLEEYVEPVRWQRAEDVPEFVPARLENIQSALRPIPQKKVLIQNAEPKDSEETQKKYDSIYVDKAQKNMTKLKSGIKNGAVNPGKFRRIKM